MIVEYVRKGGIKKKSKVSKKRLGGRRIGVLVAVPNEDSVGIGWSLCNSKAGDKFDPMFGLNIAIARATTRSTSPIARSMVKKARKFVQRAVSYYKDKKVEVAFAYEPIKSKNEKAEVGC